MTVRRDETVNYRDKNRLRPEDERDLSAIKKIVEPFESFVQVPDSLSPENIKALVLSEKSDDRNNVKPIIGLNRSTVRKIVASAACAAVVLSVLAVSLGKKDGINVNDLPYDVSSNTDSVSNVSAPESEINRVSTSEDSVSWVSGNDISAIESSDAPSGSNYDDVSSGSDSTSVAEPPLFVFPLPGNVKYLDHERTVYSTSAGDYSAVIERLNYIKEHSSGYAQSADRLYSSPNAKQQSFSAVSFNYTDDSRFGGNSVSDDRYVYSLSEDGIITISDYTALSPALRSTISLENEIGSADYYKLLIYGNTLVVIYGDNVSNVPCTFAAFFDVTSRREPKRVRTFMQEGYLYSAFLSGGQVCLITNRVAGEISGFNSRLYKNFIPATVDSNYSTRTRKLVAPSNIIIRSNELSTNYVVISTVNMRDMSKNADTCAILDSGRCIKTSDSGVYIAGVRQSGYGKKTDIVYLSVSSGIVLKSSAVVLGAIKSTSDIDIYRDCCRVAVTGTSNGADVYVFSKELRQLSCVRGVCSDTGYYKISFFSDYVYVLPSRDSLPVVVKATSGSSAKVVGKMNGMNLTNLAYDVDGRYFIGVANRYDSSDENTRCVEINLYDNSNPLSPRVVGSYTLGRTGSFCPAVSSSAATRTEISLSADKTKFSVPLVLTDENGCISFSGAYIFRCLGGRLRLIGTVSNAIALEGSENAYLTLIHDRYVRACFFKGNRVVGVSRYFLISADMSDFSDCNTSILCGVDMFGIQADIYYGWYFKNDSVDASAPSYGIRLSDDYSNRLNMYNNVLLW